MSCERRRHILRPQLPQALQGDARFNVVGCGFPKGSDDRSLLGAINNEYFPAVVPFTGDLASLDAARLKMFRLA